MFPSISASSALSGNAKDKEGNEVRKTAQMLIREDNNIKSLKMNVDFDGKPDDQIKSRAVARSIKKEESGSNMFLKPAGVDVEGAKMKGPKKMKRERESVGENADSKREKKRKMKVEQTD